MILWTRLMVFFVASPWVSIFSLLSSKLFILLSLSAEWMISWVPSRIAFSSGGIIICSESLVRIGSLLSLIDGKAKVVLSKHNPPKIKNQIFFHMKFCYEKDINHSQVYLSHLKKANFVSFSGIDGFLFFWKSCHY